MKVAVLTSSRADYSIYYPLLKKLRVDSFFDLHIIAFGTHTSKKHGHTVDSIIQDGFDVSYLLETTPEQDSPEAISKSIAKTIIVFSNIWGKEKYDLVLVLGDRYEMLAAVISGIPFNVKFAHIHGGETTLGAIDNTFRHAITLASTYHFCTTNIYKKRIAQITGKSENVFNVGALSIDNLCQQELYSIKAFKKKYNIDLSLPTILITFHPETVDFEKNEFYIGELISALYELQSYQHIITMPNADTMGLMIRNKILAYAQQKPTVFVIENFGTIAYLSCMKHCSFLLGNTSSGFVEASYFPKTVINLGNRQQGRINTPNILQTKISKKDILKNVHEADEKKYTSAIAIYGKGQSSQKITSILKKI